ncbi:MAG: nitrite reductase (NADH) small subunit [Candidatus Omnitrophota bacterium]|jgi:nitrite reductase (NADH) small subunit
MQSKKWFYICDKDDIPLREGRCVKFDGNEVALFNLGEDYRAIENTCPHKQGPLSDGIVSGDSVTCPLHNRIYDLKTGSALKEGERNVKVYPTKVIDDQVYIALENGYQDQAALCLIKASSYFKVQMIIRSTKASETIQALEEIGCMSYSRQKVLGRGAQHGLRNSDDSPTNGISFLPKTMLELIIDKGLLESAISNIVQVNQSGAPGDGKIFVMPLEEVSLVSEEAIKEVEEIMI